MRPLIPIFGVLVNWCGEECAVRIGRCAVGDLDLDADRRRAPTFTILPLVFTGSSNDQPNPHDDLFIRIYPIGQEDPSKGDSGTEDR